MGKSFPIRFIAMVVLTIAIPIAAADPPNIVLILADDMGYGDPRCYEPASKVPTPNIDRLASEGMRFTDAHSPSAVCTPTRYGILTGRYAWRTRLKSGVLGPYSAPLLEPDRLTLAGMLSSAGYATACVGKWHLGMGWATREPETVLPPFWDRNFDESKIDLAGRITEGPLTAGFDSYFGTAVPNFPPYCFIENDRVLGPVPERPKPDDVYGNPGLMQEGWDLHGILPGLERRAVRFIRERVAAGAEQRPFFLYLPLTAPHTPIVPNADHAGASKAGDYGDLVHEVDAVVGAVLEALDATGMAGDTIVIFTSDNGSPARAGDLHIRGQDWHRTGSVTRLFGHEPNRPWRGMKADIFEGGHRVPMIVRWPGRVPAGRVNEQLVGSIDLMATVAAVLGVKLPGAAAEDSVDLSPTLADPAIGVRDHLVMHSSGGVFAIRRGPWKLIEAKGSGGWTKVEPAADAPPGQLYDLAADPGESRNLYTGHPDRVHELSAVLERIRTSGRSRPE